MANRERNNDTGIALDEPGLACHTIDTIKINCGSVISTVCCLPCMYGNALAKADAENENKGGTDKEYGVLTPSWQCCTLTCLYMCIGGFAVCGAGIYLRDTYTEEPGKHGLVQSCLAETFPLCSCAPCQVYEYLSPQGSRRLAQGSRRLVALAY